MGIYKQLPAVPEQYRLAQYADAYAGRDVWQAFVAATADPDRSDHYCATFRKAGSTWKDHMQTRGRHHALATPDAVRAWCATLRETRTNRTVYTEYLLRVEEFYSWLQFHREHPHVYHPVLMAAHEDDCTRAVWDVKFDQQHTRGGDQDG